MPEQLSRSSEKIEVKNKKNFKLCDYCFFKKENKCSSRIGYRIELEKGNIIECGGFTSKKDGKSSNIVSFGYQPKTKTLFIGFKNGVYGYPGVELDLYKDMLRADSRGKFFFARIKNKYDSVKLDDVK